MRTACLVAAQWASVILAFQTPHLKRDATAAGPISVPPSQSWDGDDGDWSSFTIQVGTPAQDVRVLISSTSSNTRVVRSDGCLATDTNCPNARGATFNPDSSSTWAKDRVYQMYVDQESGSSIQGEFGNDTVALGIQGSGGPTLKNQAVAAYASEDPFLGMFGVNPASINLSSTDQGCPSYMSSLKEQGLIPSLSFAYTAGNQYTFKEVYASLTLGGYDSSLLAPGPLSVPFALDLERSLQVGIQSISSVDRNGMPNALLPTPIMANIDTTVSGIGLPLEACQEFEKAFGLVYDQQTQLYLVSNDLHSALLQQNASVTFGLSASTSGGGQNNDVTLPYKSFDLTVNPPAYNVSSSQKYFPLHRAANDTQYVLGRTFLQEAYLIVDWERRNFSISQTVFSENAQENLVGIKSTLTASAGKHSTGKSVGIAAGVVAVLVAVVGAVVVFFLRRRHIRRRQEAEKSRNQDDPSELVRQGFGKGELGTGLDNERFEMQGSHEFAKKSEGQFAEWVDEKVRYPVPGMAEVHGVNIAELVSQGGYARPLHEMYDPSAQPVELPAELGDSPRELPAVRTARNSAMRFSRQSKLQSPVSLASPISQASRPSPMTNRQSTRSTTSRSSTLGSLNPSPAVSPALSPPSQRHNSRNDDAYSQPRQPPGRSQTISPRMTMTQEDVFSPVSPHPMQPTPFSPVSPTSPQAHQGFWERLRARP